MAYKKTKGPFWNLSGHTFWNLSSNTVKTKRNFFSEEHFPE